VVPQYSVQKSHGDKLCTGYVKRAPRSGGNVATPRKKKGGQSLTRPHFQTDRFQSGLCPAGRELETPTSVNVP
jgi:hypothetical protein